MILGSFLLCVVAVFVKCLAIKYYYLNSLHKPYVKIIKRGNSVKYNLCSLKLLDFREWLRLEETFEIIHFNLPATGREM